MIADRLMGLDEAVTRFVKDGCQLAIGGFTITRNPMAVAYEIIRQGVKDIHLVCHSNGQALDVLIGAGCVKRLEIAYGGNGRYAPTCVRFKKAVEGSKIQFEDYSNYQMSLRFLAGALSIPFIPTKSGLGSDLMNYEGFSRDIRKEPKVANMSVDATLPDTRALSDVLYGIETRTPYVIVREVDTRVRNFRDPRELVVKLRLSALAGEQR